MKNKILIILLVFFLSFCFFVLFKSLESSGIYFLEKTENRELTEFVSKDLFSKKYKPRVVRSKKGKGSFKRIKKD